MTTIYRSSIYVNGLDGSWCTARARCSSFGASPSHPPGSTNCAANSPTNGASNRSRPPIHTSDIGPGLILAARHQSSKRADQDCCHETPAASGQLRSRVWLLLRLYAQPKRQSAPGFSAGDDAEARTCRRGRCWRSDSGGTERAGSALREFDQGVGACAQKTARSCIRRRPAALLSRRFGTVADSDQMLTMRAMQERRDPAAAASEFPQTRQQPWTLVLRCGGGVTGAAVRRLRQRQQGITLVLATISATAPCWSSSLPRPTPSSGRVLTVCQVISRG